MMMRHKVNNKAYYRSKAVPDDVPNGIMMIKIIDGRINTREKFRNRKKGLRSLIVYRISIMFSLT